MAQTRQYTFAIIKATGKRISGSELKEMAKKTSKSLLKINFICPMKNCHAVASPCSWTQDNEPGSYFKYFHGHDDHCRYDEVTLKISQDIAKTEAKSKRIRDSEEPIHTLRIDRKSSQLETLDTKERKIPIVDSDSDEIAKITNIIKTTAKSTIEEIVDWFIKHPNNGEHKIILKNASNSNLYKYKYLFRSIYYTKHYIFKDQRIYYARFWRKQIINYEINPLKLYFYTFRKDNMTNKKFYLSVDTKDWLEEDMIQLKLNIQNALASRNKEYKKDKNTTLDVWLFFLGSPIPNNEWGFKNNNPDLIHIKFCEKPVFPWHIQGTKPRKNLNPALQCEYKNPKKEFYDEFNKEKEQQRVR